MNMKPLEKSRSLLFLLTTWLMLIGCQPASSLVTTENTPESVNLFMDNWHNAAATANADVYFDGLNKDAVFIGTDATENWKKDDFYQWSKKYFERGKAWDFTAIDRNVYFSDDQKIVWFDELLNTTNLGICRGSGVLKMTESGWKIEHYVLSVTSPNETVDKVTELNKPYEIEIKEIFK